LTGAPLVRSPGSWLSHLGLNAANLFVAASGGVTGPFVLTYLLERGWDYAAVGLVTGLSGLGKLIGNAPVGVLIDRVRQRRGLLAGNAIVLGACYGLLTAVPATWYWVGGLLLVSATARLFLGPLLAALALALVGRGSLNRVLGMNQGCNHLGNIAAAVLAMLLVNRFGLDGIFLSVAVVCALAVASVCLIRPRELDEERAGPSPGPRREERASGPGLGTHTCLGVLPPATWPARRPAGWGEIGELLRDRGVLVLLVSAALFHLANAPVMPLVAQHVKALGGSNALVAAVVFVAQLVMVPVSLLTGRAGQRWGNRTALAVGFAALPVRIFLYTFAETPEMLVALQALDGIGAGVFGVAAIGLCADLTRARGGFNTLGGLLATAVGLGGVVGPVIAGAIVQRFGFGAAYFVFAAIALLAAGVFVRAMPDPRRVSETGIDPQPVTV
jgi:MFS family permease